MKEIAEAFGVHYATVSRAVKRFEECVIARPDPCFACDPCFVQAKRWEGTVGRPEIQKFVGALHGKRARKGVFITTGSFSAGATAYVQTIDPKVALVDGKQLAEYMIDFGLGVSLARAYEVKKVDSDYFEE